MVQGSIETRNSLDRLDFVQQFESMDFEKFQKLYHQESSSSFMSLVQTYQPELEYDVKQFYIESTELQHILNLNISKFGEPCVSDTKFTTYQNGISAWIQILTDPSVFERDLADVKEVYQQFYNAQQAAIKLKGKLTVSALTSSQFFTPSFIQIQTKKVITTETARRLLKQSTYNFLNKISFLQMQQCGQSLQDHSQSILDSLQELIDKIQTLIDSKFNHQEWLRILILKQDQLTEVKSSCENNFSETQDGDDQINNDDLATENNDTELITNQSSSNQSDPTQSSNEVGSVDIDRENSGNRTSLSTDPSDITVPSDDNGRNTNTTTTSGDGSNSQREENSEIQGGIGNNESEIVKNNTQTDDITVPSINDDISPIRTDQNEGSIDIVRGTGELEQTDPTIKIPETNNQVDGTVVNSQTSNHSAPQNETIAGTDNQETESNLTHPIGTITNVNDGLESFLEINPTILTSPCIEKNQFEIYLKGLEYWVSVFENPNLVENQIIKFSQRLDIFSNMASDDSDDILVQSYYKDQELENSGDVCNQSIPDDLQTLIQKYNNLIQEMRSFKESIIEYDPRLLKLQDLQSQIKEAKNSCYPEIVFLNQKQKAKFSRGTQKDDKIHLRKNSILF